MHPTMYNVACMKVGLARGTFMYTVIIRADSADISIVLNYVCMYVCMYVCISAVTLQACNNVFNACTHHGHALAS